MTASLPPAIEYFLSRGYKLEIWKEGAEYKFKLRGEVAFRLFAMRLQAEKELQCAEWTMNPPPSKTLLLEAKENDA